MGFHLCEYCRAVGRSPAASSGDHFLDFASGNKYRVPDMILHYVQEHHYCPPSQFVHDVMNYEVSDLRMQTRGIPVFVDVGYLQGSFETGPVPVGFVEKLKKIMDMEESF